MIEQSLESIAEALERIALALEGQGQMQLPLTGLPGESDKPDVSRETEVEEITVEPVTAEVGAQTAQVVDLSGAEVAAGGGDINGAEVLAPVSQWTKQTLWELMNETYMMLETHKRGNEVGTVLSGFNALHIDQLDPAHYPAVADKLQALQREVQQ